MHVNSGESRKLLEASHLAQSSIRNYSVFQKKWRQNKNHNNCDKSYQN